MPEYVLDHHQAGERQRLALMSRSLDPMHRRHVERLRLGPGARTLEVGCGNGSISAWLAERVGPDGRAVAVDLRARPLASGQVDDGTISAFLAHCADPTWWTQTIAFTAVSAPYRPQTTSTKVSTDGVSQARERR